MLLGAKYRHGNNASVVPPSRGDWQDLTSLSVSNVQCAEAMRLDAGQRSRGWRSHGGGAQRRVQELIQGVESNGNKNSNFS